MARPMKNSSIEWIGEIPEGWEIVKVKSGMTRIKLKANKTNPIILSLTSKGVVVRDISSNEGQVAASYYEYNPVEKGDLLLNPMDLVTNAFSSVSEIDGVISPAYFNLHCNLGYYNKYYDYYFKLQYWGLTFFAHGKGVSFEHRWTLNAQTLMNYPIPLPQFHEQQAIADYLDSKCEIIDNIIEKQKTTIEKLKSYKQSLITEAVTKGLDPTVKTKPSGIEWIGDIPEEWEVRKLKYLGDLNANGVDKKIQDGEKLFKAVHYMNVYNNSLSEIKNSEDYLIISAADEKASSCTLLKGDALFTNSSETPDDMGHSTVILENLNSTLFGYHLMRLRPKVKIYLQFEKYLFGSYYMRKWFEYRSIGMTRYGVSYSDFANVLIILPPFSDQLAIADYLDKKCSELSNAINRKQKLIEKLADYKKSLIYECVTGKKEIA